jgi:hypothetical protein
VSDEFCVFDEVVEEGVPNFGGDARVNWSSACSVAEILAFSAHNAVLSAFGSTGSSGTR